MNAAAVVATYTATDLNKAGGKVVDDAATGAIRIKRRGTSYVSMREEHLSRLLTGARDGTPRSLEDLLRSHDVEKIKSLTRNFCNAV